VTFCNVFDHVKATSTMQQPWAEGASPRQLGHVRLQVNYVDFVPGLCGPCTNENSLSDPGGFCLWGVGALSSSSSGVAVVVGRSSGG